MVYLVDIIVVESLDVYGVLLCKKLAWLGKYHCGSVDVSMVMFMPDNGTCPRPLTVNFTGRNRSLRSIVFPRGITG